MVNGWVINAFFFLSFCIFGNGHINFIEKNIDYKESVIKGIIATGIKLLEVWLIGRGSQCGND